MKFVCPHCKANHEIFRPEGYSCDKCKKPLEKFTFVKKAIGRVAIAGAIAGIGGMAVGASFNENRYPPKIEFALIDGCASLDSTAMRWKIYSEKREFCIQALLETQKDFDYDDFTNNPKAFQSAFIGNIEKRYK